MCLIGFRVGWLGGAGIGWNMLDAEVAIFFAGSLLPNRTSVGCVSCFVAFAGVLGGMRGWAGHPNLSDRRV